MAEYDLYWLISLLLAEYAANQKCSAVLLCSADSIYPDMVRVGSMATIRVSRVSRVSFRVSARVRIGVGISLPRLIR